MLPPPPSPARVCRANQPTTFLLDEEKKSLADITLSISTLPADMRPGKVDNRVRRHFHLGKSR